MTAGLVLVITKTWAKCKLPQEKRSCSHGIFSPILQTRELKLTLVSLQASTELQPGQKCQVAGKCIPTSKCLHNIWPPSHILRDLPICNVNHKISNGRDALGSLLPAKEGFTPYKTFLNVSTRIVTQHWKSHYFQPSTVLEALSFLISFHIICTPEKRFKSDSGNISNLNTSQQKYSIQNWWQ